MRPAVHYSNWTRTCVIKCNPALTMSCTHWVAVGHCDTKRKASTCCKDSFLPSPTKSENSPHLRCSKFGVILNTPGCRYRRAAILGSRCMRAVLSPSSPGMLHRQACVHPLPCNTQGGRSHCFSVSRLHGGLLHHKSV